MANEAYALALEVRGGRKRMKDLSPEEQKAVRGIFQHREADLSRYARDVAAQARTPFHHAQDRRE